MSLLIVHGQAYLAKAAAAVVLDVLVIVFTLFYLLSARRQAVA